MHKRTIKPKRLLLFPLLPRRRTVDSSTVLPNSHPGKIYQILKSDFFDYRRTYLSIPKINDTFHIRGIMRTIPL